MSFTTEVMTQPDVDGVRPYLLVSAGALSEKIDALASLPHEVWSSTLLLDADADRVRDVLTQIRIGLEQGFINNGHSAALGRAMSYSSPSAVVREQLSGVDFYLFLRDLLDHFDERLDGLRALPPSWQAASLWPMAAWRALPAATRTLTRTGPPRATWGWALATAPMPAATRSWCRTPCDRHEALSSPATSALRRARVTRVVLGIDVTGAWAVAANALSYDYLWNENPREGRRVRLRIPCGRRASDGVLHLPRPGSTPRLSAWNAQANGSAALSPTRPPLRALS